MNKYGYKIVIAIIKILPCVLAFCALLTTVLDYLRINTTLINYVVLGLFILFMYLVSYIFKFCEYHRMFLHYFLIMNLISVYDTYVGIPVSNYTMMQVYTIITGLCCFLVLTLYLKEKGKR